MAYIDINDTSVIAGAATAANQLIEIALLTSIDSKTPTLGQKTMAGSSPVVIASDQSPIPVTLSSTSIEIGTVDQGTPNTVANAWPIKITDGTTIAAVTLANALKVDGSAVTQPISGSVSITGTPNVNVTNASIPVTQSGTWTTGRTWTLSSGTDSVAAVQSGTWNINNITGTVSLPTGAATEATLATRLADATFTSRINTLGQKTMAASTPVVIASDQSAVTVSGTVNVGNFPATQPVSGTVTANQGTPNSIGNAWPVKPTDGTNSQSYTAVGAAKVDGSATTQPISGTVTANAGTGTFQTNLAQVGGIAIALGQQLAASSIPVVTQADSLPATQNITAQDVASTTTAMANGQNYITGTPTAGSAASFTFSSFESVEVQVTGTWTGTLQSEFSIDGGTTWFTRGIKQSGVAYISSSFTANFAGGCNMAGSTNYRVRATAAWTGTATVKIVLTVNPASITVSNPLTLRDGTTQSITDTIKAASTAAVATDTSLVVALNPNTAINLPTGASTAANQTTANTSLASILANQTNGSEIVAFGTNPGMAFGDVALAAATEAAVRSTAYTEQTTNAQRSIKSDNTFDNAFFGVGNVKITYFDQTGAGPFTETLALNGTTAVNTVNTNICYIEKLEIVPLTNTTANAPLGVFGTITLFAATAGAGATIATFGSATSGHTEWAHHYVATGKTCRITSIDVSSSGNAAGEGSVFRMKSKVITGTNASEQQISSFLSIEGVSTSTNTRAFQPPYPIQVVGPARITMYATPNSATANTQRAAFTWLEY